MKPAKMAKAQSVIIALLILTSQCWSSAARAASSEDFVAEQLTTVKWGQYMAKNCQPVTLAAWPGMPTVSCTYASNSGFGDIKVVMLNAGAERMAKWLLTACADATAQFPVHCAERLALRIKCQSGNQFPIAGLVDEGKLYVFRDGVTVKLKEFGSTALGHKPTDDEQALALSGGTVESVKKFARVQGTTRAEYAKSTGHDASDYAGLAWQSEIKKAYQRAWGSDRNDLLSAWAKANVGLIDHKLDPGAKFDHDCQLVANHWQQWPISGE
jgi:hypothetical protein